MKKILKNKKFYIALVSIVLVIAIISFINFDKKTESKFEKYTNRFVPLQNEIGGINYNPNSDYINFKDVYVENDNNVIAKSDDSTSYSNKILMLYTSRDLYAFSCLCNSSTTAEEFLGYSYELYSNIDYSGETPFVPIGWNNGVFKGSFNGNGFEISNLKLVEIEQKNEETYENMEYYSMFCQNSGTITNLGLVNTSMIINASVFELTGVAPLVGLNTGTVSYCYIKDLRDAETDDDAGIITSGGYQISGMVFENQGSFNNSYVAYGIVVNYSITDYLDFAEMLNSNSGEISNLYFYNSTIIAYDTKDDKEIVEYDQFLVGKTETRNKYSTWCTDLDTLSSKIDNDNNWYTENDYSNTTNRISSAFKIETPILRGLSYTKTDDVTEFNINSLFDFLYMFELMNDNSIFASNGCSYYLNCDLDLSYIPEEYYAYGSSFAATLKGGTKTSSTITITDVLGNPSNQYTIYNAQITNTVINEGIECFGVFPWLTGNIENINFYFSTNIEDINYSDEGAVRLAVGLVSGLVDGGTINNVNVYGNYTLNTNKQYYAGGIAGMLTSKGNILNCTSSGSIDGGSDITSYDGTDESGYISGNALAGIVGFTSNTTGNVNTCLNAMTLTATTYSSNVSCSQHVGGVIGAGYTQNTLNLETKNIDLSNKGTINVGSSSSTNIGLAYVGGVIGKLIGVSQQINSIYNQGDIIVYANTSYTHYVSGVVNVELLSSSSSYLNASPLKNNKGKTIFMAGGISNAGTITISNGEGKVNASGVIYLNSNNTDNRFIAELSGIYNLGYKYVVSGSSNVRTKIDDQTINMNMLYSYAPCLITTGIVEDNAVNVETIYNLRNHIYSNTSNISNNLLYSGCILGKNINIVDARNEGDITYSIGSTISNTSFITVGVFEEVTSGYKATNIYNSGDIYLDTNKTITSNLYFNGICYENKNGFSSTELNKFNPLSSDYDNGKEGSLNNIINNGDITVTNSNEYTNITYESAAMISSNGGQTIGTKYVSVNNAPSNYIVGNINISGITYLNYSVITNTFNLGDMFAVNYITSTSTTHEVNSVGISVLNISEYSYILNSANNGTILACNLSGIYDGTTLSNVSAAGISIRNNRTESNEDYSSNNNHSKQLISYTINYGTVIAYDNRENITSSNMAPNSSAAGILSMGVCNILNTVNYGNIYGNETSSGIFGVVYFEDFQDEVTSSNTVSLANSINYGNVKLIEKGANNFKDTTSVRPVYSNILEFFENDFGSFAKNSIPLEYANTSFSGSIFALLNFNGSSNANYVTIRYLINFLDYVPFVGAEAQTPDTVSVDVSNMYSAYKIYQEGVYLSDTYLKQYMTYSPLTTGSETISTGTYYGVFNEEFAFRKAIAGDIELDISTYPTDQFLTDYFQFVGYTKINDTLLDKIGWRNIAYYTAANDFARDLEGVSLFLDKYQTVSGNTYSDDISTALNTGNWIYYCSDEIIEQLIEKLFTDNLTLTDYENIINYVFSDECEESVYITHELRQNIVEYLLIENPNVIENSNLLTFDNDNSYSSVLSVVLSTNSSNDIKDHIKNSLDSYINNLDDASIDSLLYDYLNYLESNGTSFFENNSEQARYDLAVSFFENIDDSSFYSALYYSLSDESRAIVDSIESTNLKLYSAYNTFTAEQKLDFYLNILTDNVNNISTYLDSMEEELNIYSELNQKGYSISNFDSYLDSSSITASASDISTITERVNLYNQIRTTETFKNYMNSKNISTLGSDGTYSYVAKATELRNTFRSDYAPIADEDDDTKPGWSGDLAYTYATSVTPKTYFYGPYMDTSKATVFSNTMPTAAPTTSGTTYSNQKYSVFVSDDQDFMDEQVENGYIYDYTAYYYEYGSGASNNQFTSRLILGNYNGSTPFFQNDSTDANKGIGKKYGYSMTDFTGVQVTNLEDVWVTDDEGVTFNARGGVISPYFRQSSTSIDDYKINTDNYSSSNYYGYFYITDANGVVHYFSLITDDYAHSSDHGDLFTNDGTNCTYHGWANFIWNYGKTIYHAYATTKLHPTRITGFWRHKDGTWWWTNKNSGNRARTSSYIDYSVDDLLNLDGLLSLYDGITQSSDEREIINDLFNNYFINDSNFESVVKACFLEKLAYTTGLNVDVDYINSFVSVNINTNKTINSLTTLKYLVYDDTTVYDYLLSAYTADSKSQLLQAFSSNATTFKEIVEVLLNANSSNMTDDEKEKYLSYLFIIEEVIDGTISLDSSGRISVDDLADETAANIFDEQISSSVNLSINYDSSLDEYYITFDSLAFDIDATNAKILYTARGLNGNTTLTIEDSLGNTSTQSITSSNATYEYELNDNATGVILTSNSDVCISNLDIEGDVSTTYTDTTTITQDGGSSNIAIYSKDNIISTMEDMGYSEISLNSISLDFNVQHSSNGSRYIGICTQNNSTSILVKTNSTVSKNTETTITYEDGINYLNDSSTITLYARNGTSSTSLSSSSATINSVTYEINFSYTGTTREVSNLIPTNNITLENAYDRIHKYDAAEETAVDGYIQYTTSTGIASDYASLYLVENAVGENFTNDFIDSILMYLMPLDGSTDLVSSFQNQIINDEVLMKSLASYNNDNIKKVINSVDDIDILKNILKDYLVENSKYLFGSIIDNLNTNSKISAENKKYILAAYLASDYSKIYEETLVNSDATVTSTAFYTKLNYLADDYQYILTDGSFDNNKFDEFVLYIGYDMTTSGYGIYALASSKGILNGQFIPDNFALDSMDAKYIYSTDHWVLSDQESAEWRGGVDSEGVAIKKEDSVNAAFLNDMKQLKLSISTTIFELNLKTEDGDILYSSEDLIDLENGTIVYYIPSDYASNKYVWESQSIANGAVLDKTEISENNYISVDNSKTITVTAEDTTIKQIYMLSIISKDMDFVLSDANPNEISATGGNISIELTSLDNKELPYGLDLTPYISIEKDEASYSDYSFATTPIIDENGDCTINLIIDSVLPWGEYEVIVSLFGNDNLTKSTTFSKLKSTESEIIDFEYDGTPQTDMINNKALETQIAFGRLYTYEELTNYESSDFYLSYLSYSDNAELSITADYSISDGLITYVVTYVVTAEDTNYSSTYVHTLIEYNPIDISNYAAIYKDGRRDSTATISDDKKINISFDRGESPNYRIKYNLNRVYTDGVNVEYSFTTSNENASVGASYTGLSINIPDSLDAGTYTFTYNYYNMAIWKDTTEYEKNYSFPIIYVLKDYSKDALLKRITFLENSAALTASTTVMNATDAITSDAEVGATNEKVYTDLQKLDTTERSISIGSKTINYNNIGTDYSTATNFFTVGSVSNATLSDYTPVFAIEEHAQIYQYTTEVKLKSYGLGLQGTKSDTNTLTTTSSDTLYLYVPFEDANGNVTIYLVECIDGEWGKIYTDDYTDIKVEYDSEAQGFTYNEINYTLCSFAGSVSGNESLYMDYIGTPVDDHFWYVSYVVFAEDYLKNTGTGNSNLKFYHVAIIDATNTIYLDFTFDISEATNFKMDSFYLNITNRNYITKDEITTVSTSYASAFVTLDDDTSNYLLETQLQVLPYGYFYFTLDLPAGYICEYKITSTGKNNINENTDENCAYLPPASIITQKIEITIYIKDGSTGEIWAESTSDVYGQVATEVNAN